MPFQVEIGSWGRFENILKVGDFFKDKTKFGADLLLDLKFGAFLYTKKVRDRIMTRSNVGVFFKGIRPKSL